MFLLRDGCTKPARILQESMPSLRHNLLEMSLRMWRCLFYGDPALADPVDHRSRSDTFEDAAKARFARRKNHAKTGFDT